MRTEPRRSDLVEPELSYRIIGCAYDVSNNLGPGHHEKYYQRALAESLAEAGIKFEEQYYFPLRFKTKVVGKGFVDFLVENKIIVEIKKGDKYSLKHINQVLEYLKTSGLKLAILINFGTNGVAFKRVVNFDS
ncbi:MAG: GxxExxY protein [Candidatus Liptonbacteria bacterium]|nr:GxxExxY protein [Candidatus Liptonbacteria bacterium]